MAERVGWLDFEREPDMTGDNSGDEDKWFLTIADGLGTDSWPEEIAVIVHRTCDGKYPIDGEIAEKKRHNAQVICDALNAGYVGRLWGNKSSAWPSTAAEREAYHDWRYEIANGDTVLGFRAWLAAREEG